MSVQMVSMRLSEEDLARADALKSALLRSGSRTEVFKRALHLLYWAFVEKEGTALVILKGTKEVGRMVWADEPITDSAPRGSSTTKG